MEIEMLKTLLEQVKVRDEQIAELILELRHQRPANHTEDATSQRVRNLADTMTPFVYDPENNAIFETWYARYETVFATEAASLTESVKVRLLLQKFTQADYQKYADTILPKKPSQLTIEETVKQFKGIFGYKETKFAMRHKCLGLSKSDAEDFTQFAARVNKHAEKFDITKCTPDDLKVLLFISGLRNPQDSLILEKLLAKVDNQYVQFETVEDPSTIKKLTLQDLVNEAHRLLYLKHDKNIVENPSNTSEICRIQQNGKNKWKNGKKTKSDSDRSSPTNGMEGKSYKPFCKYCGGLHRYYECEHRQGMHAVQTNRP